MTTAATFPGITRGRIRCWGIRRAARAVLVLCLATATPVWAGWQPHEDIQAAAVRAAEARTANLPGKARIVAAVLDPRLRLRHCDRALVGEIAGAGRPVGRLTAQVRCDGSHRWRLFLPVQVSVLQPVVVAARALARDTVLTPGDVRLAEREVTGGTYGVLAEPAQVVGQRLRRSLETGAALSPALLDAPVIIRRGQEVTVEAGGGTVQVRSAGIARSDGTLGQTIDVENATSGRVLQAVVRSAGLVQVRTP